ncbi:MAG: SUMF1/EgtB/PvdO family nonheme iron enzyme [Bacteroidales bacterium]|nr:SUMF1/EgtB/PvdO family nonheme iron enzyme [Bacteroidales bacterium]
MKKLFVYLFVLLAFTACKNSGKGELIGVQKRSSFYQSAPYGMAFVPLGSFTMGASDQDIPYAQVHEPKVVSVQSFFIDETEITNNEYRQFVYWVRDSIARTTIAEKSPELAKEYRRLYKNDDPETITDDEVKSRPLNWDPKIDWEATEVDANGDPVPGAAGFLDDMFIQGDERFYRQRQIDSRKLNYAYFWIDLLAASKKEYAKDSRGYAVAGGNLPSERGGFANRPQGFTDRSVYIKTEVINIYPDTLSWIHDFTYSYNDPMAKNYFWHPTYDNYPVVGVNWKQAKAFSYWRTELMNAHLSQKGQVAVNEFRLPTEVEWEWAARGGWDMNPYPWGGPYLTNDRGCFLANFKPQRGNYVADGGIQTVIVAHYPANDWGLYDMSGNVSEWTLSAYDESSYNFSWDMNPNYEYNAEETDPPQMKKKVIRGGSWKDIGYFLQVTARQYEYQDTAKSYIGFRCMQTYLGRMAGDSRNASEVYR